MISGAYDRKKPGYRRERQGVIGSKSVDMVWIREVFGGVISF
jgi:hypothetical protein